jgi:hypothetical protein
MRNKARPRSLIHNQRPNCSVSWEIDLNATSIEDAAKQAYKLMRNAKENAPLLTIWLGKEMSEFPMRKTEKKIPDPLKGIIRIFLEGGAEDTMAEIFAKKAGCAKAEAKAILKKMVK